MNMKNKVSLAILTESSKRVGTGHLIECLNLAESARKQGFDISFWTNRNLPKPISNRISFPHRRFSSLNKIKDELLKGPYDAAVFNFRKIDNDILLSFRKGGLKTLCIDEMGRRRLDCDVVVNPLIVNKYHKYPSFKGAPCLYAGADYLSISPKFRENRNKKKFNGNIKELTVSMGGADRTGTTLKLIDVLAQWRKDVRKNIIIGGCLKLSSSTKRKLSVLVKMNFRIYNNIDNAAHLFMRSDVVFTAGGDTLYELACIGVPAIVLHEDEHERENGLAFQRQGFGIHLGKGSATSAKKIMSALDKFDDPSSREKHSLKGRRIVDGKGAGRILDIVKTLIQKDDRLPL